MKIKSKRLSKYLYSLGFDKQSKYENNNEIWLYKKSKELDEALDFYFAFRNKMSKKPTIKPTFIDNIIQAHRGVLVFTTS